MLSGLGLEVSYMVEKLPNINWEMSGFRELVTKRVIPKETVCMVLTCIQKKDKEEKEGAPSESRAQLCTQSHTAHTPVVGWCSQVFWHIQLHKWDLKPHPKTSVTQGSRFSALQETRAPSGFYQFQLGTEPWCWTSSLTAHRPVAAQLPRITGLKDCSLTGSQEGLALVREREAR